MSNTLRTTLLLGLLTGLLLWVGQALGGAQGLVVALVFAAVMNLGSYWFSDRIVLRMYGAQELQPEQAPELYGIVRELAAGAHMPMPRVYLIPSDSPNAFATGRSPDHAAVAVTAGIMRLLTPTSCEACWPTSSHTSTTATRSSARWPRRWRASCSWWRGWRSSRRSSAACAATSERKAAGPSSSSCSSSWRRWRRC